MNKRKNQEKKVYLLAHPQKRYVISVILLLVPLLVFFVLLWLLGISQLSNLLFACVLSALVFSIAWFMLSETFSQITLTHEGIYYWDGLVTGFVFWEDVNSLDLALSRSDMIFAYFHVPDRRNIQWLGWQSKLLASLKGLHGTGISSQVYIKDSYKIIDVQKTSFVRDAKYFEPNLFIISSTVAQKLLDNNAWSIEHHEDSYDEWSGEVKSKESSYE